MRTSQRRTPKRPLPAAFAPCPRSADLPGALRRARHLVTDGRLTDVRAATRQPAVQGLPARRAAPCRSCTAIRRVCFTARSASRTAHMQRSPSTSPWTRSPPPAGADRPIRAAVGRPYLGTNTLPYPAKRADGLTAILEGIGSPMFFTSLTIDHRQAHRHRLPRPLAGWRPDFDQADSALLVASTR
jgi:hypothetical protein